MVRCCLQLDAPRCFLASLAEVDLTAVALAGLAKTRLLNGSDAERNVDTVEMPVAARCMGVGCIHARS